MYKSAKILGSILFLLCCGSSFAKMVVYHTIDPPYNPDYVSSTPDPNDANNYFFLQSNEPPAGGYNINAQYAPIMRDQFFYRDYGDWTVGDYYDPNAFTIGSGAWD
jgi:hypothetical protein